MGFADIYVDMIWRIIANNWYPILFNGKSHGFFHSARGVKLGDPLSPALIILSAKVLSAAFNALFEKDSFREDTIIFASADKVSSQVIMKILKEYEGFSGGWGVESRSTANYRFLQSGVSITYLGCPIFHARMQKLFYKELMKKVRDELQVWKGKLLFAGGKAVLTSSVLQSIPIYLLSIMVPPKCVIQDLYKLFNRFFWQTKEEGRGKHWSAWEKICNPKNEGGLGFRSLYDISKALFPKVGRNFGPLVLVLLRPKRNYGSCVCYRTICKKYMEVFFSCSRYCRNLSADKADNVTMVECKVYHKAEACLSGNPSHHHMAIVEE
ncbi:uncharacterized protein LOC132624130 [Lycium barbarum]|uniref:uncharacterized protein LOC132624130 n=1 Tax=Lycium barbarum TaxID=112863 RepID=UPI00293EAD9B|nr:uncharacterized protein LOC132624130 [Lycium barbarum]